MADFFTRDFDHIQNILLNKLLESVQGVFSTFESEYQLMM